MQKFARPWMVEMDSGMAIRMLKKAQYVSI
jgi:hypothetical protein